MPEPELIQGDRRADRRYAFELPLRFTYEAGGVKGRGSGQTKDLSRGGTRFISDMPLPQGAAVELSIEWPFLLHDVCPLELRVWGDIVRSDECGAVVQMRRYEFRTCGARSFHPNYDHAANWSIVA